ESMLVLPAGPFESEGELARVAAAAGYRASGSTADPDTRRSLNRMSRAKLSHSVLDNGAKDFLRDLGKTHDIRYYAFARDLRQLGHAGKGKLPEPPAPGSA